MLHRHVQHRPPTPQCTYSRPLHAWRRRHSCRPSKNKSVVTKHNTMVPRPSPISHQHSTNIVTNRLEILIAIQRLETPRIPYLEPSPSLPLSPGILAKAQNLTTHTLSYLPGLTEPLQHVILLLHQLGVAFNTLTSHTKTNIYIMRPLYDAQYTLLHILEKHKNTGNLRNAEHLLAQSLLLYFSVGPRAQPPQMRLLDLLVARVKAALLPYLGATLPGQNTTPIAIHDPSTNDLIAWSLSLGTIVSAWLDRQEHTWFQAHIASHLDGWDEARYNGMLKIFPTTEGYVWLDMGMLWRRMGHMGRWR
jgi:hypothetical protein